MKLTPLHDWAVIVPAEAESRTAGGLFIPDSAKQKPEEGVVESIGPGALEEEKPGAKKVEKKERKFVPTTVKPGDRVLYERWAGKTHTIGNEERILVREKSILGWIERTAEQRAHTTPERTALMERAAAPVPQKTETKLSATSVSRKPKKTATKNAAKKSAKKTVKKTVAKKSKAAPKAKSAPKKSKGKKKKK